MNVLVDLSEAQCAEIEELISTLRKKHREMCAEYSSTMSQRAATGQSPEKLNAGMMELARWKSTFTRTNLIRVMMEYVMTQFADKPEEIIKLVMGSEKVRFQGRLGHRVQTPQPVPTQRPRPQVMAVKPTAQK